MNLKPKRGVAIRRNGTIVWFGVSPEREFRRPKKDKPVISSTGAPLRRSELGTPYLWQSDDITEAAELLAKAMGEPYLKIINQ